MLFQFKNNESIQNIIYTILCIASISPLIIGSKLYYILMIICAFTNIYLFSKARIKHININILTFLIITFISIAVNINRIEIFFKPIPRFIGFVILLLSSSNLLFSSNNIIFQKKIYNAFIYAFILISLISTLLYVTTGFGLSNEEGGFNVKGFADHPNHLSYMSGITSIYALISLIYKKNISGKIIYLIILFIGINGTLIGGARIILVNLIICFILILLIIAKNLKQIILSFFCCFAIIACLLHFELLDFRAVNAKMEYAEKENSITASRDQLWDYRIKEFNSSPILGVGAFSVDTKIVQKFYSRETGQIEGGSTYLTILSMTGIIGFIAFLYIIITPMRLNYKIILRQKYRINKDILLTNIIFIFNLVILVQTAIIFNTGFYYCFFFWISISSLYYNKYIYGKNQN